MNIVTGRELCDRSAGFERDHKLLLRVTTPVLEDWDMVTGPKQARWPATDWPIVIGCFWAMGAQMGDHCHDESPT
ncbi:hypothetical protein PAXRUDRAFT_825148 [Paxillus rubicundulus Ve08.2h10]|uniref:Uncharacterized protein n=1 Tax=Paxillus rubicundulus Ve08.2h10 TaxID=930991 RepID=A0A0D0EB98_9AGAM|nr:hypothetical protein PAXRUDRAFT_825148 [Paxillus rubicundulus Ve08.2h10]